jgi:hypothetical protein
MVMVMVADMPPLSFWKSDPSVNWISLPAVTLAVTSAPVMAPMPVALTLSIVTVLSAVWSTSSVSLARTL